MTASRELQAGVRSSNGFDLVDSSGYLSVLDSVFAAIGEDEMLVEAGIAWETRHGDARTDGTLSYFILTNNRLYFPVTRKSLLGAKKVPVAVSTSDIHRATSGKSEHGFLTLDFYSERGERLAGITLHPMADPEGRPDDQARRIARAVGVEPR